jgi:assimilatory nitrate reductase catalytic subunit
VAKAELPYQALLLATHVDPEAADGASRTLAAKLAPWLSRFAYASLALAGRDAPAVVLRLAHHEPIPADWLAELDRLFGLDAADCLRYTDSQRHISKRARLQDGALTALRLTGEGDCLAAGTWLREAMIERLPAADLRRWLFAPFAPLAQAPAAGSRGRIVCNCLNVSENDIQAAIAGGDDFEALQAKLKCGTSCGSCVPEIKRMVAMGRAAQVV